MLELRCRYTKVSAHESKNERFKYAESTHNLQKCKPNGVARVVDLNCDKSEFTRILEQGAMDGLK